jgi:hypothetical protein
MKLYAREESVSTLALNLSNSLNKYSYNHGNQCCCCPSQLVRHCSPSVCFFREVSLLFVMASSLASRGPSPATGRTKDVVRINRRQIFKRISLFKRFRQLQARTSAPNTTASRRRRSSRTSLVCTLRLYRHHGCNTF